MELKGMILAAGLGTRMKPLTWLRAKPAVPFLNRPLILYSLELLKSLGIKEIVVNLHHLPETVRSVIQETSYEVEFSYEARILGTGGAIANVRDRLRGTTVVVSNGKVYMEGDISEVLRFHHRTNALVTMVVIPYTFGAPFNPVLMDSDNNIREFTRWRPSREIDYGSRIDGELKPYIYTGLQVLAPELLEMLPEGASDSVNDIYPLVMKEGHLIKGFVTENIWYECSNPERYLANSLEVLQRKGLKSLANSPLSCGCEGVVAGRSVSVPESSVLENCIVWDDVILGRSSSYRNAIICSGVEDLPDKTHFEHVVLLPHPEKKGYKPAPGLEIHPGFAVWPLQLESKKRDHNPTWG